MMNYKIALSFLLSTLLAAPSAKAGCDVVGKLQKLFKTPEYFRIDENNYIAGKSLKKLEFENGYSIQIIKSNDGTIHAIDSEYGHLKKYEPSDSSTTPHSTHHDEPFVKINRSKAKNAICGQYQHLMKNSDFKKSRETILKALLNKKMMNGTQQCFRSLGFFGASYAPWIGLSMIRSEAEVHNILTDHGDNFYMTIPLMMTVNDCLKKSPLIGVAAGTTANLLEEVSHNGRSLSGITERKDTDWNDLGVGMSAVGSYALWITLSEKILSFRFEQACR